MEHFLLVGDSTYLRQYLNLPLGTSATPRTYQQSFPTPNLKSSVIQTMYSTNHIRFCKDGYGTHIKKLSCGFVVVFYSITLQVRVKRGWKYPAANVLVEFRTDNEINNAVTDGFGIAKFTLNPPSTGIRVSLSVLIGLHIL